MRCCYSKWNFELFLLLRSYFSLHDCLLPAVDTCTRLGCEHSAAITTDGLLLTWGQGDGGRLGHGDCVSSNVPKVVQAVNFKRDGMENQAVYCCDKFTMLISTCSSSIGTISPPLPPYNAVDGAVKVEIKASRNDVEEREGKFLDDLHRKWDAIASERTETDGKDEKTDFPSSSSSKRLTRGELGSLLLSLLSRVVSVNEDKKPIALTNVHSKAKEYSYESSPHVFLCLCDIICRLFAGLLLCKEDITSDLRDLLDR